MNKNYKQVQINLSEFQIKDEVLEEITQQVQLISSKQLAKILGKKNDNSWRAARSNGTGFKFYTDKRGCVYYNLIKVFNELGIKL